MKGIILAGGNGSRLYPITFGLSKQLLPVFDKPMIYYPLSILMLADIREILIITSSHFLNNFQTLLGSGENFGVHIEYAVQENPNGIAEAFLIGEKFIGKDNVCLILGDNIFWGQGLSKMLLKSKKNLKGAKIFAYQVKDPERFGIIEIDNKNKVIDIEEKPKKPKSNYAVTGLYFYNNSVINFVKKVLPSSRGELEISSLNKFYIENETLEVELLGRGFTWFDTGTEKSLLEASIFIENIQKNQAFQIACLEEIALLKGWISSNKVLKKIAAYNYSNYYKYLSIFIKNSFLNK